MHTLVLATINLNTPNLKKIQMGYLILTTPI